MTVLASSAAVRLGRGALDSARARVATLADGDLDLPTVNDGWSVRDLMAHLIGGNRLYAQAIGRQEAAWAARDRQPAADPLDEFDRSAAGLLEAITSVENPNTRVSTAAGPLPVEFAIAVHATDMLVHSWDLAVATGQDRRLDPALCHAAIGIIEQFPPAVWGNPRFYARPVPTISASPADQLIALTGRNPAAPPR